MTDGSNDRKRPNLFNVLTLGFSVWKPILGTEIIKKSALI
jgi:hypothetical protein